MTTRNQFRLSSIAAIAALALALLAPLGARAQDQLEQGLDQTIAAVPASPSWDETSGYGAVESGRASIAVTGGEVSGPTGHEVNAAIGYSWDDSSGYGAVETNRAALAPGIVVNQVSSDVRWAPESSAAVGDAYVSRTSDLGGMQEEYFLAAAAVEDVQITDQKFGPR